MSPSRDECIRRAADALAAAVARINGGAWSNDADLDAALAA